jgi:hypothetical protein
MKAWQIQVVSGSLDEYFTGAATGSPIRSRWLRDRTVRGPDRGPPLSRISGRLPASSPGGSPLLPGWQGGQP